MKRKFDFFILLPGRVASLAFCRSINQHPKLQIPPFQLTDELFRQQNIQLLQNVPGYVIKDKCGLATHWRDVVWHPQTPYTVSQLVHPKIMIQLVRHPFQLLTSFYNHMVHRSLLGLIKSPGTVAEYLAQADVIQLAKFYEIGMRYAQYFDAWHVFDFSELLPQQMSTTMRTLYTLLDVDADFSSPVFTQLLNTDSEVAMNTPMPALQIASRRIQLKMCYQRVAEQMPKNYVYIATLPNMKTKTNAKLDDEALLIYAKSDDWHATPMMLQQELLHSENAMLVEWALSALKNIATIENMASAKQISSLAEHTAATHKILHDDVSLLLKKFPKLATLWQWPQR